MLHSSCRSSLTGGSVGAFVEYGRLKSVNFGRVDLVGWICSTTSGTTIFSTVFGTLLTVASTEGVSIGLSDWISRVAGDKAELLGEFVSVRFKVGDDDGDSM